MADRIRVAMASAPTVTQGSCGSRRTRYDDVDVQGADDVMGLNCADHSALAGPSPRERVRLYADAPWWLALTTVAALGVADVHAGPFGFAAGGAPSIDETSLASAAVGVWPAPGGRDPDRGWPADLRSFDSVAIEAQESSPEGSASSVAGPGADDRHRRVPSGVLPSSLADFVRLDDEAVALSGEQLAELGTRLTPFVAAESSHQRLSIESRVIEDQGPMIAQNEHRGIEWGELSRIGGEPGRSAPGDGAVEMVSVTLELPPRYQGVEVFWSAIPLDSAARRAGPEAWAPPWASVSPVVADLIPGEWLIEAVGTADAAGLRFAARVRIPEDNARLMLPLAPAEFPSGSIADARELPVSIAAPERALDRSRASADGDADGHGPDDGYFCPTLSWNRTPCPFVDENLALGFVLPQGFNADWPWLYSTAAGVEAEHPTLEVYRSVETEGVGVERGENVAVLNPRQWVASNGPCWSTRVGPLCLWFGENDLPFDAERQELVDALTASLRRFPSGFDYEAPGVLDRLLSGESMDLGE